MGGDSSGVHDVFGWRFSGWSGAICGVVGHVGERACFDEVEGVAEVLAGGAIRGGLEVHLAVSRAAER